MSIPSLDALVSDLSLIQSLPVHAQATLYPRVARLEAGLRAALLVAGRQAPPERHAVRDEVLTIREAAKLLRVSRDTLYRKWKRLPGAFKDGLDGRVKFRRASLERYVDHLQTTAVKG